MLQRDIYPTARARVVITGIGAVTPLGNTYEEFWQGLIAGRSGVSRITAFDPSKLSTQIAAEVKNFDPDALIGRRDARKMDRFAQLALVAANEAVLDAALPADPAFRENVGVMIASGIGGIGTIENAVLTSGPAERWDRISPFFVPMLMGNAAGAQISMHHGLRGPAFAVSSACASSNDALGVAYDAVATGRTHCVLTGGSESTVVPSIMGGFASMKALSTRNAEPERASRPFDIGHDGFVLGEGAGILVFEELEHAKARGARIYCEVLGYGQSADAYHVAAPDPESRGVILAFERALAHARIDKSQIGYINMHATSTPLGDAAESQAVERVFGDGARALAVSATKSMHGHLLGAAGAVEAIATLLAITRETLPPTINYEVPDPECRLDCVPNVARKARVDVAMSSSFGFGGHNTIVILGRYQ